MNTEPPTGDDLQQMLVTMKQNVLERAPRRQPRRTRRTVGIVTAIVLFIGIGTASGAVALGMVPQPFTAAAPSPSPTDHPTPNPPASAPITATPDPETTPTPTSTRRPFALDDPGTWTISADEVGPVALGAPTQGELDDLTAAYTADSADLCPNPNTFIWNRPDTVPFVVTQLNGVVSGVLIGGYGLSDPSVRSTAPTTAEGIGVGSTLDDLRAAYPDLESIYTSVAQGTALTLWTVPQGTRNITFGIDSDGVHVAEVWVGDTAMPPYEYCG